MGFARGEQKSFEYILINMIRHLVNKMEENKKNGKKGYLKQKKKNICSMFDTGSQILQLLLWNYTVTYF